MTRRIWLACLIGVAAVRRNRTRALLTMLGMIVGVVLVIGIASVGSSAQQAIENHIGDGTVASMTSGPRVSSAVLCRAMLMEPRIGAAAAAVC